MLKSRAWKLKHNTFYVRCTTLDSILVANSFMDSLERALAIPRSLLGNFEFINHEHQLYRYGCMEVVLNKV